MSDVVILCYHALSDDWPADLNVHPDRFERQIGLMLDRGYEAATFSEAVLDKGHHRKTLVVTFDDAFRSVQERALPILQRLGIPATVFTVTRFAPRGERLVWDGIDHWGAGPHAAELASMTWGELRDLSALGWEIGSHTRTHPHLTALSDSELQQELRASRDECARGVGRECESIAYPYGDVDPRVTAAARAAGYRAGAALPAHAHRQRPLEWPRVGVYWNDDLRRFKLKVSRIVRAARLAAHRRR